MIGTILLCIVCLFVGAAFPITLNRIRRKLISGKLFGKLDPGDPDPTRP